ncbi:DUF833-domain-containing protein [Auriculariales sp. MPI-PUGE-AT-0066]|nr:DUF833-domain-containing protein [Auriculariales sp. MPI-PUGE-AT-0066]
MPVELRARNSSFYDFKLKTMCIALWALDHPDYALETPTDELCILSGRDVVAGGTWIGINRSGNVAVLTNIREDHKHFQLSRGELASSFLLNNSTTVEEYVGALTAKSPQYAGFNLLLLSPSSASKNEALKLDVALVTNHGGGGHLSHRQLTQHEHVCGGLSNAVDGSDNWPKVADGTHILRDLISTDFSAMSHAEQDASLVNHLLRTLSEEHVDPIHAREDLRKTIRVPPLYVRSVPTLLGSTAQAKPIEAATQLNLWYATRLTTIILIRRDGEVLFLERDIYKLPASGENHVPPVNMSNDQTWIEGDNASDHDRAFRFRIQS